MAGKSNSVGYSGILTVSYMDVEPFFTHVISRLGGRTLSARKLVDGKYLQLRRRVEPAIGVF